MTSPFRGFGSPEPVPEADGQVLIGVAIPVPEPHGGALQKWRADFGDPLAWSIPAHVTIVPPLAVDAAALGDVAEHVRCSVAACAGFTMVLAGTGTFRPVSPVVYVTVRDGASECVALESSVRSGILGSRRRFPFHPHVTVAHELDDEALDRARAVLADYEASFEVSSVQLYRHAEDGVWRSVAEFALGPQQGPR